MKKILRFTRYLLLIAIIAGFSGCEKDTLTLLTDGEWQFSNLTTTSLNEDVQALVALGKAIMTDGTISFDQDGTYIMDSPVIDAETGTYELVGSQLIFNDGTVRTASIDEITKDKLVYLETYIYLDTETYTIKYSWKR